MSKTALKSRLKAPTSDPEVRAMRAIITGLRHFNGKTSTSRHFSLLIAVALYYKMFNKHATVTDLSEIARLKVGEFDKELDDMVERRYLHEMVPTFGPLRKTYKLGSVGGTIIRSMRESANGKSSTQNR